MREQRHVKRQFAICVRSDDPDLLTPRMVYEVLPDEGAAKSNYVRVIDNEGEDYLYPADYFVLVSFPSAVEHALAHVLSPATESLLIDSKTAPNASQNPA